MVPNSYDILFKEYLQKIEKFGFDKVSFGIKHSKRFESLLYEVKKCWAEDQTVRKIIKELPEAYDIYSHSELNSFFRYHMMLMSNYSHHHAQVMVVKQMPYWQYIENMSVGANNLSLALNGIVRRYDDPFWKIWYPPNSLNEKVIIRAYSESNLKSDRLVVGEGIPTYGDLIHLGKLSGEDIPIGENLDTVIMPPDDFACNIFEL